MRVTDKFVFFYGNNDIYSNFYPQVFMHNGIEFKWSEQAVMVRKAILFGSKSVAMKILSAQSPTDCKFLGRSREIPFDERLWQMNRERVYTEVLLDKFSVPALKDKILSTGDKILVEASPRDIIWGIGLHAYHPHAEDPTRWRGQNLLGKCLMSVRDKLNQGV